MSKLHVKQIEGFLTTKLSSCIDMSDYINHRNPKVSQKALLSRALAVLAVSHLAESPLEEIAKFVTDGTEDGGIDLIYFDKKSKQLF
jgi:hypothetical protein